MQFPPASVAFTQLLSAICIMMGCEHKYPAPVQNIVTPQLSASAYNTVNSPSYIVVKEDGSTSEGKIVTRRGRLAGKGHLLRNDDDLSNQIGDGDDLDQADDDHVMLPPIVEIPGLGRVEGYHMRVVSGRQIYAFEGIPYAQAPVTKFRFQATAPHLGWNATKLDAKDPGPPCIQLVYGRIKGSEDCLRLNIYSPKIPNGKTQQKHPVIIFIHGGLFLAGAGSNFGPAYLLRENVILVTFNYRLGIMGAFSTGDSAASGNWGLKDQAFAINWVHKHISSFGGDPDHLVIMGQSAGGVCAHLQMMSPLARDKLRAAITISGGAYNFWGLNSLDQGLSASRSSARFARCSPNQASPALLACMQNASAEVLVANQIFTFGSALPVPMIEPPVPGAFLSETPDSAYQKGHVARIPLITTVTSEEINAYIAEITGRGGIRILNGLFDVDAASLLGLRGRIPSTSERSTVNKIRSYYGISGRRVLIPRQLFTQVGNARYFTVPFHRSVQMHSQLAPTYAGIFNYTNNPIGRAERLGIDPKEFGVSHTDDLIFVLNSTNKPPITENHYGFAVTKLITNMYANFGKSNIPSFTGEDGNLYNFWDSVINPENFQILQIDEEVKMIDNPYTKSAKFWESLHIPDMKQFIKLSVKKSS